MAEIVDIKVDEVKRKVRIVLDYSLESSEQFLNTEIIGRVVAKIGPAYFKKNEGRIMKLITPEAIKERVIAEIARHAVQSAARAAQQ